MTVRLRPFRPSRLEHTPISDQQPGRSYCPAEGQAAAIFNERQVAARRHPEYVEMEGPGKSPNARRKSSTDMPPLYEDPCFTFRFADDRIIPRFHLEGVEAGRHVSVFKIDPGTGERLGLLATATVGEGGWVDLPEPIIVRAGEAFVAVPEPSPR